MHDLQRTICNKYKSKFHGIDMSLKVGIALETLHIEPIHAVRTEACDGTTGWFIWCGEFSEDADFFKPLCANHLDKYCPHIIKYLALEPGFRVLIDRNDYEDVWFDEEVNA
ncbi:hypothetical protein MHO82_25170 [Vibrio sp. Of7-15]|uniref:immunity protein Imm33 domain-containing protein n=1 Tax=Vibrio sp. Of7-15 TaxID=2724879 RepID=UPI001EF1F4ED|nr:hypothetical protein [Vibrio sp. Of7-15]MCG7500157.1 hypothetical protein [Vibrio sp. Of7-15]